MSRPSPNPGGPRAFVLIAVLITMTAALLVATSLLFVVEADLTGAARRADETQTRLLAWSGLQVVMRRLDQQRDRILAGDLPELDDEYVIYEADGREGIVRLLAVTPSGARLAPEAGRLDLNHVDADILAATGFVDAGLAAAIVEHRDGVLRGAFQSVAELLDVPGMRAETLYGPLEDVRPADEARGVDLDLATRVADRLTGGTPRGLADLVTVYGFEPALQRSGTRRIDLNVEWSAELGSRVDERFGAGASEVLRPIFERGTQFDRDAVIFEVLREVGSPPEDWPDIVDALTTDPGALHFGRLDLNSASEVALAALPGLDEAAASTIVRARDALGPETRATVAWPAIEGIVTPEAYDELAGRVTTRSWTYRVRLAAGERPVDAGTEGGEPERPIIVEAVVDLCDPEPRLAYLRDVTHLQLAARLAGDTARVGLERDDERGASTPDAGAETPPDPAGADPSAGVFSEAPSSEPPPFETPRRPESARSEPPGPEPPTPFTSGVPTAGDDAATGGGAPPGRGASSGTRIGRWRSARPGG